MSCPQASQTRSSSCSCSSRLAAGTIDSLLGKLRAISAETGLGGEWDDRLGIGNPISHPSIKNYLKLIKEEQAKARICRKKAAPLFLEKLQMIAQFILTQLHSPRTAIFALSPPTFSPETVHPVRVEFFPERFHISQIPLGYYLTIRLGKLWEGIRLIRFQCVDIEIWFCVRSRILSVIPLSLSQLELT